MALINAQNIAVQAEGFSRLPIIRQLWLLLGLAASIALGGGIIMWSASPKYSLLYSNLTQQDVGQVVDALQKADIDVKVDHNAGAIMVPANKVHEARLKLAGEALPNGSHSGFELLEKQERFGVSQFMETARYQRALEGELARTIATLSSVQSARVHLALPKQSVFVRNRRPPSASVVVNLYPGRKLEDGQVQSVVHLVASSIPNLEASKVTVIDQKGQLLTSSPAQGNGVDSSQLDYVRRLEEGYIKRIEDILTPIVGVGGVRAQVAAEVDFTFTEQTQESFNPDNAAVRSEQTMEEQAPSTAAAVGVPGALSNQPPPGGVLTDPEPEAERPANGKRVSRRATRNFEVDKTISHTRIAAGSVRRLSVAVVVDNRQVVGDNGDVTRQPFSGEELTRLTELVRDAVGFSAQRGDTVNVINSAFTVPLEPQPLPEVPLWERPWVWDLGKQVAGGVVVLILVFGVLRPVLRELAAKGVAPKTVTVEGMTPEGALPAPTDVPQLQQQPPADFDTHMSTARNLASQDPKRVAQVVKHWVQET